VNVASAARLADVPARWRPVALAGAAAVAWAILAAILPHGMPAGIVLLGAVLGSLTGLSAVGLVLVYRASRVVNFSQASLGSAAGVLAILVFISWHWNYFLCLTLGVVVAASTGALVDRVVIRRFFWAPRLILTLATIGLAQVLGGIELGLPSLFGQPLVTNSFRTPLSSSFTLDPVLFTGNHVLIVVIVPVVAATLAWFLTKTSLGVAIRAASENAERALVLGIPVRRLSTIVWAIAAGLSALAVMLTAPIQALPPTVLAGPALLLPALAAAVLARMEHLPAAFVAGVGIGILQQVTFWTTSRSSATDVAFLVVIMGALLLQRDRLSRADDASASSWLATGETTPIPAELRRLPEVVWARRGVIAAVAAVALVAPALLSVSQVNLVGTVALVYALIGVSLVVLTGWSGQLSLGQFALAGVGGVVAANLLDSGVDLILVLAGASLGGAVGALVVGLPALRIRGLFLGVTTLALAVAMSTYFLNPSYFPSLLPSDLERPVLLTRFDLSSEITLYYFALVVVAAAAWTASNLRASRVGRLLIAVRDNERAARARGVNATLVKLGAFAFSGGLAGLAGGLLVLVFLAVGSGSFSAKQSFDAFAMVVVGGLTSVSGAIAGAFVLRWTQYAIGGSLQLIVTGAGVLVLLLAFPGGIGQLLTSARDHYLRRVAARRRIVVPSLIADVATAEPVAASSEELHAIVARRRAARTQTNPTAAEVEQLRQEGEALRRRLEDLERQVSGGPR
jgi:branched-chain amino acid transport system permease protein